MHHHACAALGRRVTSATNLGEVPQHDITCCKQPLQASLHPSASPGMNINDHQRPACGSLQAGELATHQRHNLVQLGSAGGCVGSQALGSATLDGFCDLPRPVHLRRWTHGQCVSDTATVFASRLGSVAVGTTADKDHPAAATHSPLCFLCFPATITATAPSAILYAQNVSITPAGPACVSCRGFTWEQLSTSWPGQLRIQVDRAVLAYAASDSRARLCRLCLIASSTASSHTSTAPVHKRESNRTRRTQLVSVAVCCVPCPVQLGVAHS